MSDNPSIISLHGLSKHFGPVRAVDEVSFDVEKGEFFALLGPSGCGKTTLLRLLAGFESPTKGEIYIDGQEMSVVPPYERPTNMVFQNYAIFPHLNVRGNIAFGMRKAKLPKAELNARIDEALEMIKLTGYGDRRSDQLSGGQRQRVALARALIKRPKVLLLDEPLGALDKKLREQMQLELRALQRSVGITFVFVTHDQEEALTMSDRIAVMSQGKVLQIDTPENLYEAPNNREVAGFIGTMNFFAGTIREARGDLLSVDAGPLGIVSARAKGDGFAPGVPVVVAIRPEKLRLQDAAPGENVSAVQGRINNSAYLGDRSHFYVELPGAEHPVAVASQNYEAGTGHRMELEKSVWLTWSLEAIVLLPLD